MRSKYISIDGRITGGIPTIKGTRINCIVLYKFWLGGDPVGFIAYLYDLKVPQVKAAISFCQKYYSEWPTKRKKSKSKT